MNKNSSSVLFLGKPDDWHVNRALSFCLNNFSQVTSYLGQWGEAMPDQAKQWEGDYIISYLSRWIVPSSLLEKAKLAAINFHPAPPSYPGFGPINFALYEGSTEYGTTCHYMKPKVDAGAIIAVKKFPILETDSVETLLQRTHDHQLSLFYDVIGYILNEKPMPTSSENWTRAPFTKKDFNKLETITPDMSKEEVAKRVKATTFGKWKPSLTLHGFTFELK